MPIRIVHLGKFYPPAPGGIETHLRTLALSQAKLGADVRVICVNHADREGRDVTWSRFRRTPSTEEQDGLVRITRVGRIASLSRLDICPTLLTVLRKAVQSRPDVIHVQTPNPTMLLALSAVLPRAPIVVTHHSDVIRQIWLRHALTPFERRVYDRAATILTDSPLYAAGSPVLSRYREKVAVLPLGIDLDQFLKPSAEAIKLSERYQVDYGRPLWLLVGRLVYYKGIEVALRALTEVPGQLLIIGNGPLESSLRSLSESLGVRDRVIWQGHASSDELIGAYRAATALWFPSVARSEAYGLVQVEAMASGCPVINTSIPHSGVSWVSVHEETGLTVPVNNSTSLATASRRLIEDRDLREKLGNRGRERAMQYFSQERMAEQSLRIYRTLLGVA